MKRIKKLFRKFVSLFKKKNKEVNAGSLSQPKINISNIQDAANKAMTLEEFMENVNMSEGYYAVWCIELLEVEGYDIAEGFRGAIMTWSNSRGLEDIGSSITEWVNELPQYKVLIKLLQESLI